MRGNPCTNGVESFRAALKRAYAGACHKASPKHLDRHVRQFAAKRNLREEGALNIMRHAVAGLIGKRLMYRGLIADDGLPAGAHQED